MKRVKGLVLPVGPEGSKPVLKFSCASVQMERKSVGFLRIGVLPQLVFEDVDLRITDSADSKKWAQELKSFFLANSSSAKARFKRFRISPATENGFISAPHARFDPNSHSLVLEGVEVKMSSGRVINDRKGIVHLEGMDAGRLSLPELTNQSISITDAIIGLSPDRSAKPEIELPPNKQ